MRQPVKYEFVYEMRVKEDKYLTNWIFGETAGKFKEKFVNFPVLTCSNGKKSANIILHAEMETNPYLFQCKDTGYSDEVILCSILCFIVSGRSAAYVFWE